MRGELGYLGRLHAFAESADHIPKTEVTPGQKWDDLFRHNMRRSIQMGSFILPRTADMLSAYHAHLSKIREQGVSIQAHIAERIARMGSPPVVIAPKQFPTNISPDIRQFVFWYLNNIPWKSVDMAYSLWRRQMGLHITDSCAYQNPRSGQSVPPNGDFPYDHFHILCDGTKTTSINLKGAWRIQTDGQIYWSDMF